ncbi:MAG TPA: hypothetical protein VHV82_14360 [Sporichthyaceae bacterium]|jgi:hypothetical protein|nr:hypothetical protein [Sporichthyaceae bacterium]
MNKMTRFGAAGCAAAAGLVLLPTAMADATTVAKNGAPPKPPTGIIQACNRSGYMFNVYVDGPSLREDDLAGLSKSGECSAWDPVLVGAYQIGFGLRTTSGGGEGAVIIQARFRRNNHVYYKVFNNEGNITTFVNKGDNIELDLMIPQG